MDETVRLQKIIKAQQLIIEGQERLMLFYRAGTRRGVDGAMDKIERGRRQLAKLGEQDRGA